MIRYFAFLLILGCIPNRAFRKDFTVLSQSPCIDGTILNIYESGCVSTYVGHRVGDTPILKIRCTFAKEESWMTRNSFYVVPQGADYQEEHWRPYCFDANTIVYSSPVK